MYITASQRVLELERAFEKISNPVDYSLSEQSNGKKVGYIQIKEFNAVVTDKVREVSLQYNTIHLMECHFFFCTQYCQLLLNRA